LAGWQKTSTWRTPPDEFADGTLKAMERGEEDIFIDSMAVQFRKDYFGDSKALEKQLSGFLPVASS